jgi:hypothetical protein
MVMYFWHKNAESKPDSNPDLDAEELTHNTDYN